MINIEQTKSFRFRVDDKVNKGKEIYLFNKCKNLINFKNELSKELNDNFQEYIDSSKFDLVTKFRDRKIEFCNSNDITDAIEQVQIAYKNKFTSFRRKVKRTISVGPPKISFYKKNVSGHKKGEFKSYTLKKVETKFTKVVEYLVKYYNENTINRIRSNVDSHDLYRDILYYIDKLGGKLIDSIKRQQFELKLKCFKRPIIFRSHAFSSLSEQNVEFIQQNNNKKSVIDAFVILSGQTKYEKDENNDKEVKDKKDKRKLFIPIKYSKKFHGNLKDFNKDCDSVGRYRVSYIIKFNDNKTIDIILTKKSNDEFQIDNDKVRGIDVNFKHNLFSDKDGRTIDYDRELLKDYSHFLLEMDNLKKRKIKDSRPLPEKLSIKNQVKKNKLKVKINEMINRKCNELIKETIALGYNHLVIEDLQLFDKLYGRSEEFEGIKINRLLREIHLSSAKHKLISIGRKHGIQVTIVHPEYSSIGCRCGCINTANRTCQEKFKCVGCGLEMPADQHSPLMLEDRVNFKVLKDSLLCFDSELGYYVPKRKKREEVKKILEDFYYDSHLERLRG